MCSKYVYFDLLPNDVLFLIIDKLDFESIVNMTITTSYYKQARILKYMAIKISNEFSVLKEKLQQKNVVDMQSIKKFIIDFRTLQNHEAIISNAVKRLAFDLSELKEKESNENKANAKITDKTENKNENRCVCM